MARVTRCTFLTFVAPVLTQLAALHAAPQTPPSTLWADYDPDKGDFKEEIVSQETKDGVYYRETTDTISGRDVRRR